MALSGWIILLILLAVGFLGYAWARNVRSWTQFKKSVSSDVTTIKDKISPKKDTVVVPVVVPIGTEEVAAQAAQQAAAAYVGRRHMRRY